MCTQQLEDVIKEHKSEFKEKLEEIRNPHREKAEKGEIQKEDEHRTEHKVSLIPQRYAHISPVFDDSDYPVYLQIDQLWHHAPEGEKKVQVEHEKKFDFTKVDYLWIEHALCRDPALTHFYTLVQGCIDRRKDGGEEEDTARLAGRKGMTYCYGALFLILCSDRRVPDERDGRWWPKGRSERGWSR